MCVCVGDWQPTPKTADVTVTKFAGYVRVRILMNRWFFSYVWHSLFLRYGHFVEYMTMHEMNWCSGRWFCGRRIGLCTNAGAARMPLLMTTGTSTRCRLWTLVRTMRAGRQRGVYTCKLWTRLPRSLTPNALLESVNGIVLWWYIANLIWLTVIVMGSQGRLCHTSLYRCRSVPVA